MRFNGVSAIICWSPQRGIQIVAKLLILLGIVAVFGVGYLAGQSTQKAEVKNGCPPVCEPSVLNDEPPFSPPVSDTVEPGLRPETVNPETPDEDGLVVLLGREGKSSEALGQALVHWVARDPVAAVIASQNNPDLAPVAMRVAQLAILIQPQAVLFSSEVTSAIPNQRQRQMILNQLMVVDPKLVADVPPEWFGNPGDENSRMWQQTIKFAALARDDPQSAWQEAATLPTKQDRFSALYNIAGRWAADDPQRVLEEIERLQLETQLTSALVGTTLEAWAQTDPDAAMDWLKSNGQNIRVGQSLGRYAARQDVEKAIETGKSLHGPLQRQFISGVAREVVPGTEQMRRMLDALEGHPLQGRAVIIMSQKLIQEDPNAAFEVLESVEPSVVEAGGISSLAAFAWQADEQRTTQLLDRLSESEQRVAVQRITDQLYAQTPELAQNYVDNLRSQKQRDTGNHRLVDRLLSQDKFEQAQQRVDEIEDKPTQLSAVQVLITVAPTEEQAKRIAEEYEVPIDIVSSLRVR